MPTEPKRYLFIKKLTDIRCDLSGKPYLKNQFSHIELKDRFERNLKGFLTTKARDFTKPGCDSYGLNKAVGRDIIRGSNILVSYS